MKKIIFIIVIVIIVLSAVMLVKKRKHTLENTPLPDRPVPSFYVDAVSSGTLPEKERYSGILQAEQTVNLAPQVQGKIQNIYADEGEYIKKGDVLAVIDSREITEQINSLASIIKRSESDFQLQKSNLDRKKDLLKSKAISIQTMDEAKDAYNRSLHLLEGNRAELAALKTKLGYYTLKSPFNGIVVKRMQEPGDMTTPGKPVLSIENPSKGYKISVQVPENLAKQSLKGNVVLLYSQNTAVKAAVSAILPVTGENSSLSTIEIYLSKKPFDLPGGSYIDVDITVRQPNGFIVSEESILHQKNDDYVFVVNKENRVNPVKVDVLGKSDNSVIVSGNLQNNDTVILADESRLLSLRKGQQINTFKREIK